MEIGVVGQNAEHDKTVNYIFFLIFTMPQLHVSKSRLGLLRN